MEAAAATGLARGTPVAVAGHDHVCALPATGIVAPGPILDSIGTAESLLGVIDGLEIGDKEFESGLAIVPHVVAGRYCWLGGLSAAGASLEWLRALLSDGSLSYDQLEELVDATDTGPTGILYFPYLHGGGSPCSDGRVRAAFVGLSARHGRGDLVKAAFEGTAYAIESIRRTAERITGTKLEEVVAVGGGTRSRQWMQIRADVSGCHVLVPAVTEATVLGAALTASLGSNLLLGIEEMTAIVQGYRLDGCADGTRFYPDAERHREYRRIYEDGWLPFQRPLRGWAGR